MQPRIPPGAECPRRGARGPRVCSGRAELGGGLGHHPVLRPGEPRHPDAPDWTNNPGQKGAEVDRELPEGGNHGAGGGRRQRGGNPARGTALAALGEHLSGCLGQGTGEARAELQPLCGRLQHLRGQRTRGGAGDGKYDRMDQPTLETGGQREQERHGEALGTKVSGVSDQP